MTPLVVFAALILDHLLGEPKRFHPLVGFGTCAAWLESKLNKASVPLRQFTKGIMALTILVVPTTLVVFLLEAAIKPYGALLDIVVLYWAIGLKSLDVHIAPILQALQNDKLGEARGKLSQIVSRDTAHLNEQQVTKATIETTLENGCDAVFGALFWYLLGGAAMVVAYRLINTLDAMWGYRNPRFEHFGKCAARLDDVLNYLPARLTALSYALCGNTKLSITSWRSDAAGLASPNAGPVMCAGAGSLNVELGGAAFYQGKRLEKPRYGGPTLVTTGDIRRSLLLLRRATILWCVLITMVYIGINFERAYVWL